MFTYPLGLRRSVNFGEAAALKAVVSCFHGRQRIFISNIVPRQVCTGMGLGGSCPGGGRLCLHREGAWLELYARLCATNCHCHYRSLSVHARYMKQWHKTESVLQASRSKSCCQRGGACPGISQCSEYYCQLSKTLWEHRSIWPGILFPVTAVTVCLEDNEQGNQIWYCPHILSQPPTIFSMGTSCTSYRSVCSWSLSKDFSSMILISIPLHPCPLIDHWCGWHWRPSAHG